MSCSSLTWYSSETALRGSRLLHSADLMGHNSSQIEEMRIGVAERQPEEDAGLKEEILIWTHMTPALFQAPGPVLTLDQEGFAALTWGLNTKSFLPPRQLQLCALVSIKRPLPCVEDQVSTSQEPDFCPALCGLLVECPCPFRIILTASYLPQVETSASIPITSAGRHVSCFQILHHSLNGYGDALCSFRSAICSLCLLYANKRDIYCLFWDKQTFIVIYFPNCIFNAIQSRCSINIWQNECIHSTSQPTLPSSPCCQSSSSQYPTPGKKPLALSLAQCAQAAQILPCMGTQYQARKHLR